MKIFTRYKSNLIGAHNLLNIRKEKFLFLCFFGVSGNYSACDDTVFIALSSCPALRCRKLDFSNFHIRRRTQILADADFFDRQKSCGRRGGLVERDIASIAMIALVFVCTDSASGDIV